RAAGLQILAHPAESDGALGPEHAITRAHLMSQPLEARNRLSPHQLRMQMEHQRGFHLAAMDAVPQLVSFEETGRRAEREVVGAHDEHRQLLAQAQSRELHERSLTAVSIENHQLANA